MIVRGPREDRFTILNRRLINDDRLSFRALGLLTYILDKPDDWRIDSVQLATGEGREGRDAVRSALTELEAVGYLRRRKVRAPNGTFVMESTVYDAPHSDGDTGAGEPGPGIPAPVNQASLMSTETDDGTESDASVSDGATHRPPPTRRPDRAVVPRAERDAVFQAVVVACGMEYGEMTKRQQRACGVATSELIDVAATPDEVRRRADIYAQKYEAALTPSALANQWAALREVPTPVARNGSTAVLAQYLASKAG